MSGVLTRLCQASFAEKVYDYQFIVVPVFIKEFPGLAGRDGGELPVRTAWGDACGKHIMQLLQAEPRAGIASTSPWKTAAAGAASLGMGQAAAATRSSLRVARYRPKTLPPPCGGDRPWLPCRGAKRASRFAEADALRAKNTLEHSIRRAVFVRLRRAGAARTIQTAARRWLCRVALARARLEARALARTLCRQSYGAARSCVQPQPVSGVTHPSTDEEALEQALLEAARERSLDPNSGVAADLVAGAARVLRRLKVDSCIRCGSANAAYALDGPCSSRCRQCGRFPRGMVVKCAGRKCKSVVCMPCGGSLMQMAWTQETPSALHSYIDAFFLLDHG